MTRSQLSKVIRSVVVRKLNEVAAPGISNNSQAQVPQIPGNTPQDQNNSEPRMSDQGGRQLADAQSQQQKLTNDRDRIKGAIQKLEEPVRRKVADATRRMADIEKKLGQTTKKIQDIQKKYQGAAP